MNAFANPEEAFYYEWPEFPKPEDQVTEYANIEGATEYHFNDFKSPGHTYSPAEETEATVQPAVFQDFREAFSQAQS